MSSADIEFNPLFTGDPRDDDEEVQRSYTASGTDVTPPLLGSVIDVKTKRRATTELISGAVSFTPTNPETPWPLVGADPDRKALTVRFFSANPGDYCIIGDTRNPTNGFRLYTGDDSPQAISDHTGEVFISYGLITAVGVVTWLGLIGGEE